MNGIADSPGSQRLVLELPYLIHEPGSATEGGRPVPLLLFLHGIGEGFVDDPPGRAPRSGHANLLRHGPPALLGASAGAPLPPDHPLRTRFIVVSPQLPDRATSWGDPRVVSAIARLLERVRPPGGGPIHLLGFSKGGRGAFELANALPAGVVSAVVSIDAAPLDDDPGQVLARHLRPWLDAGRAAWLHHTDSLPGIVQLHRLIAALGLPGDPGTGPAPTATQLCSHRAAPAGAEPHGWLCEEVSRDARVYQWLLAR